MAVWAGAKRNDVNDVSGLPEPHGPDGPMAAARFRRAEIPQPRPARRLRQALWPPAAGGRAGARTAGGRRRQRAQAAEVEWMREGPALAGRAPTRGGRVLDERARGDAGAPHAGGRRAGPAVERPQLELRGLSAGA